MLIIIFFFFQAEDGIRDIGVTGVQTCALPISRRSGQPTRVRRRARPGQLPAVRRSSAGAARALSASRHRQGDRKSVVEGKRGDLGGRRILKKKKKRQTTVNASY